MSTNHTQGNALFGSGAGGGDVPDAAAAARLLAEAGDERTRPERLRRIAEALGLENGPRLLRRSLSATEAYRERMAVLDAIAANPAAPPDLLALLLLPCRDAFCRNPVAPLVTLEAPDFLLMLEDDAQRHLLRSPDAPRPLVALIAGTSREAALAEEARLHVGTAGEIAGETGDAIEAVRRCWRDHAGAARGDLREAYAELVELGFLPAWPELQGASEPSPPDIGRAECLERAEADRVVARALDPATPPADLAALVEHPGLYVRLAVVYNPAAPPDLLSRSAGHAYRGLFRRPVARHPNADEAVLLGLAGDDDPAVRRLVRRHPRATDAVVRAAQAAVLGPVDAPRTSPPLSRFVALLRPATPLKVLHAAADSDHWHDRLAAALAIRPNTRRRSRRRPLEALLETLTGDGNRVVRAAARERLRDPGGQFTW
uniref:Leucine rich repeat variant n=1 Tax=uncultured Armatimonadetes bacterium TaxID=157466 RepID=A0A6J4J487_9BACT|nr:hypothetical protein AVDCRST_MAG63-2775 [uncultured Armatimonadetes bacterium]